LQTLDPRKALNARARTISEGARQAPGESWPLPTPGPRLEALLVVGLVVAWLAILLPTLSRFPPINNDEGREANLYWVAAGIEPGAQRINAYRISPTWGTGGLQGATAAALFKLFDNLHLPATLVFQARLSSLLWGGALLLATYWIGRLYWGRAVGLASLVLLAVSNPFLLGTHTLRPDVQIVTLALVALALTEYGLSRGRAWPAVTAGIVLALGWDTHMNTLALVGFVGAAVWLSQGWTFWRKPTVRWLALGALLGSIYYVAVRIVPDPAGFLNAAAYWIGVNKRPPSLGEQGGGSFTPLLNEWLRYSDYFGISPGGVEELPELLLVVAALGTAFWRAARGSRPDRLLLIGLVFMAVVFVAAVRMKSQYYMLLSFPFWSLLIAATLEQVARLLQQPLRAPLRHPTAAPVALAGLVLLATLWPLKFQERVWDKYVRGSRYRAGQEYYQLTAQLDQLAPPGAKILAPPLYWFGLKHHPFSDIFVYERVRNQYGETPGEYLAAIKPDLVITDAKIASDRIVERELYRALDERAPYQLVVRHKNYGDVAVYRLSW
jgi:4-amino-4-deoxy-L-arabinose transferase-like glycosyltransferase